MVDPTNSDPINADPEEKYAKVPIPEDAQSFWHIFKREQCEIDASRRLRQQASYKPGRKLDDPDLNDLSALALSGSGIRSAVFNLGILQGLAKHNLLCQFDYLSSVSGGSCISAWLVSWMRRAGCKPVEKRLQQNVQPAPPNDPTRYFEPDQVRFLRRNAPYFMPRYSFFDPETWNMLAIYFRNLILNLTLIIIFGAGILLVPDLVLWRIGGWHPISSKPMLLALFALLVCASATIGIGLGGLSDDSPARRGWRRIILFRGKLFTSYLLFFAAISGTLLLREYCLSTVISELEPWLYQGSVLYTLMWILITLFCHSNTKGKSPRPITGGASGWFLRICMTMAAGALQGYLVFFMAHLFILQNSNTVVSLYWTLAFGPPLLIATLLITSIFHVGLAGRAAADAFREWFSRIAVTLSLCCIGWIVWFGITFYAPPLVLFLTRAMEKGLGKLPFAQWQDVIYKLFGVVGTLISGGGALWGAIQTTRRDRQNVLLFTGISFSIFVIGFLFLSFLLDHSLQISSRLILDYPIPAQSHLSLLTEHATQTIRYMDSRLFLYFEGALLLLLIFAWRVDINEFSMYSFFKNRLTKIFLGASQSMRIANPVTGFSEEDDLGLYELNTTYRRWREPLDPHTPPESENLNSGYDGPMPIFCATLNETKGKELASRTRTVKSFIFSPLHCGYGSSGFRTTKEYSRAGGPTVGTAAAISGAIFNPKIGYDDSPILGFLMAVLNIRSGWWAGNPRHPRTWRRYGPRWGLLYLLKELFVGTDHTTGYVYLSDGSHFEGLGIYELVRRKCRFIISSDADGDQRSLGSLVEKCRSDFGIEIAIDIEKLKHDENRISKFHFAVGSIHYRDGTVGTLLYIKPMLTGDEPEDVKAYAAKNNKFPYELPANQFFDESQFESYRALGEHIFDEIFAIGSGQQQATRVVVPLSIGALFRNLQDMSLCNL
jgi:hypothetical protein